MPGQRHNINICPCIYVLCVCISLCMYMNLFYYHNVDVKMRKKDFKIIKILNIKEKDHHFLEKIIFLCF